MEYFRDIEPLESNQEGSVLQRGRFNVDRTKCREIRHIHTGTLFKLEYHGGIPMYLRATRIRHWLIGGMKITTVYFKQELLEGDDNVKTNS